MFLFSGGEKKGGRGGKKGGEKNEKKNVEKNEKNAEEEDEFGDEIVCRECKMYFKTQKKLAEHYKKNPEHDPNTIVEEKNPDADEKPMKVKRKMHGHRGF
jgi:hypothetical protein